MRKSLMILTALCLLSACSTYPSASGRSFASPSICRSPDGNAVCMLAVGAMVVGAGALLVAAN